VSPDPPKNRQGTAASPPVRDARPAATVANTAGVRNPNAVLAARLGPAELSPPAARPTRPPWCGDCDQVTRMLDYHSDAPRPCLRCKSTAARDTYARRRRKGGLSPPVNGSADGSARDHNGQPGE